MPQEAREKGEGSVVDGVRGIHVPEDAKTACYQGLAGDSGQRRAMSSGVEKSQGGWIGSLTRQVEREMWMLGR